MHPVALLLILILTFALTLWLMSSENEGFLSIDLQKETDQHQQLQLEGERRFNDFARVQGGIGTLPAKTVDDALGNFVPVETARTASMLDLIKFSRLGAADDGTNKEGELEWQTGVLDRKIARCESTPLTCEDLDKPMYGECGICHEGGIKSDGKPALPGSGLYTIYNDRDSGAPTVGSCKDYTLMKDACIKRTNQLLCERAAGPSENNPCGQCYGGRLVHVGTKGRTYTANLNVSHPGGSGMTVTVNGQRQELPYSLERNLDPRTIPIDVKEGDVITLTINQVPRFWCAWLSSEDGSRTVSLDLGIQSMSPNGALIYAGTKSSNELKATMLKDKEAKWPAFRDSVPSAVTWFRRDAKLVKPMLVSAWYGNTQENSPNAQGVALTDWVKQKLLLGDIPIENDFFHNDPMKGTFKHSWMTMDDGSVIVTPEHGTVTQDQLRSIITLSVKIPATLVAPTYPEECQGAPLMFTKEGVGLMGANPCFKEDGSFNPSLICIQRLFLAAGGKPTGTAYPKSAAPYAAKTMDAVLTEFNEKVNVAIYGVDSTGAPQDFTLVRANALEMLGESRANPCDSSGPRSNLCQDYLWRTSGKSSTEAVTNLNSVTYDYCSAAGRAAPLQNENTIADMRNKTNDEVRRHFQDIYQRATGGDIDAVTDCYGPDINKKADSCSSSSELTFA